RYPQEAGLIIHCGELRCGVASLSCSASARCILVQRRVAIFPATISLISSAPVDNRRRNHYVARVHPRFRTKSCRSRRYSNRPEVICWDELHFLTGTCGG